MSGSMDQNSSQLSGAPDSTQATFDFDEVLNAPPLVICHVPQYLVELPGGRYLFLTRPESGPDAYTNPKAYIGTPDNMVETNIITFRRQRNGDALVILEEGCFEIVTDSILASPGKKPTFCPTGSKERVAIKFLNLESPSSDTLIRSFGLQGMSASE